LETGARAVEDLGQMPRIDGRVVKRARATVAQQFSKRGDTGPIRIFGSFQQRRDLQ
jgi:hypothetical protein